MTLPGSTDVLTATRPAGHQVEERRRLVLDGLAESLVPAWLGEPHEVVAGRLLAFPGFHAASADELRHAAAHELWDFENYYCCFETDPAIDHRTAVHRMLVDLVEDFVWSTDPDGREHMLTDPRAGSVVVALQPGPIRSFADHFGLDMAQALAEARARREAELPAD